MSKPVGYYVNTSTLIDDMQEDWGGQFQKLNNSERLWMIFTLSGQLCADDSEHYNPNEISKLCELAMERAENELSLHDKLGLIEALVNQIKYS